MTGLVQREAQLVGLPLHLSPLPGLSKGERQESQHTGLLLLSRRLPLRVGQGSSVHAGQWGGEQRQEATRLGGVEGARQGFGQSERQQPHHVREGPTTPEERW